MERVEMLLIKKSDFYKNKKLFNIDDTDANKTLVCKIDFTGCNENDVIRIFLYEASTNN